MKTVTPSCCFNKLKNAHKSVPPLSLVARMTAGGWCPVLCKWVFVCCVICSICHATRFPTCRSTNWCLLTCRVLSLDLITKQTWGTDRLELCGLACLPRTKYSMVAALLVWLIDLPKVHLVLGSFSIKWAHQFNGHFLCAAEKIAISAFLHVRATPTPPPLITPSFSPSTPLLAYSHYCYRHCCSRISSQYGCWTWGGMIPTGWQKVKMERKRVEAGDRGEAGCRLDALILQRDELCCIHVQ